MSGCRVRIVLRHNENGTPWKWCGYCTCGWGCMSWAWRREDETGALPMALDHLGIAGATGYTT